jgi:hypothetical protein
MGEIQGFRDGLEDGDHVFRRKDLPGLDQGLQGLPVDVLHDDERQVVFPEDVVDGDDVRVVQPAGGLGLTNGPVQHLLFFGTVDEAVEADGLDGHVSFDIRVEASIDDPHAPFAEDAEDLIFADPLDGALVYRHRLILQSLNDLIAESKPKLSNK